MTKMKKDNYVPVLKTKKDINAEALDRVEQERTGRQLGLLCRFSAMNKAIGKYFRFKQVTLIAGASGHGKSTLLNMLLADFLNKRLNQRFEEDVIIVHNTFEMLPVDEVLRNVSGKVEKSHLGLLSSEWIPVEVEGEKGKYNRVTDDELNRIREALTEDEDLNHYYFEEPTNIQGIMKNILTAIEYYKLQNDIPLEDNTRNPKVIVAIDHTLLVVGEKGESTLDTMASLGRIVVFLKKKGFMVLLVGQLNNEIEKAERIKNNDLHYPMKSDIYAQGQLYNACDNVLIIHQPELLGILQYGKNRYSTSLLVHIQFIKQRFGKVGSVWLKNALERGQFIPFNPEPNTK